MLRCIFHSVRPSSLDILKHMLLWWIWPSPCHPIMPPHSTQKVPPLPPPFPIIWSRITILGWDSFEMLRCIFHSVRPSSLDILKHMLLWCIIYFLPLNKSDHHHATRSCHHTAHKKYHHCHRHSQSADCYSGSDDWEWRWQWWYFLCAVWWHDRVAWWWSDLFNGKK
jgi:hypothetical protein